MRYKRSDFFIIGANREWLRVKARVCREYKWTEAEFDSTSWDFIDVILETLEAEHKHSVKMNKKYGGKS